MNIISFPVATVTCSHNQAFFHALGFKFFDNGIEGSYVKLPEGWSADFKYHNPFEFFVTISDNQRRLRASAMLLGQTAKIELFSRYRLVNYKPWLSPHNSELRLIDNATGYILFSQSYYPKFVPNKTSTDLISSNITVSNKNSYEAAYNNMLAFCIEYNITLNPEDPLAFW